GPDEAVLPEPTFAPPGEPPARRRRRPPGGQYDWAAAPRLRYRIEVGRNQGATPKEIVGAIANEGGIDGRFIGQINLFDDYSTVELPELPEGVLTVLRRTRVRQLPLSIRPAAPGEGEKGARRRADLRSGAGESKPPAAKKRY
ncbi:MAG: DbpA RNA binding domain-containing protein, partial [Rhodocyclaceae bacterium]|nr:DbpA RNA binding domain-containing protein [Rhodocyclaceae bacterium]